MRPRDDATEAQVRAAAPLLSTWLAANAGSGKTRVLTDRVARLLLTGVQPQRILCLTYTKAAASEMQNRLFRRLGEWAMLDDARLRTALVDLGHETALDTADLLHARTLFARAIETPGGLKIQTIHAFCAAILRRFPLEAQVSPGFTEIEDRAANLLRAEIVRDMAQDDDAAAVQALARYLSEDFDAILREIVNNREAFGGPASRADIWSMYGLPPGLDRAEVLNGVYLGGEADMLEQLVPVLLEGSTNDLKAAAKLTGLSHPSMEALEVLENVLLTSKGTNPPFAAKTGSFPTKPTRAKIPHLLPRLNALMLRVEAARQLRLALDQAERTATLHDFAGRFLPRYAEAKAARGWLDFDDLIVKARDLLQKRDVAAWVLYRLDGGIDHILVDEAQDTSPTQWEVIELLTQEMTSGEGARDDAQRTMFVVGDKKQSIYSFQGADPREFDRMQAKFAERLQDTNRPLQGAELVYSFRSAPAILSLVDTSLSGRSGAGYAPDTRHRAFKDRMPGRVDLWPLVPKAEKVEKTNFDDPVDVLPPEHHNRILADRIAAEIRRMIDTATPLPQEIGNSGSFRMRPVRAGDFLILVQRRSALFNEIIRACKQAEIPIAGADRLKVGAELAVRDLAAVMSFLALPEDSLSLATTLRSPLFGWSEQALFTLAQGRRPGSHLWPALRAASETHSETLAVLEDLRNNADFLRPYDLIERVLTRHDGRRKLLARLGPEAEDGIDAFLGQALAYENSSIPSLTGFLQWMQTDALEIKRQIDGQGDLLRVMTVHGAKGLEAPIVILPDTARIDDKLKDQILIQDGRALWRGNADDAPDTVNAIREAVKAAQRAERDRLQYVAMTRAEKWLIVAGAGELDKEGDCWFSIIQDAMQHHNPAEIETDFGTVRRVESGDWTLPVQVEEELPAPPPLALPALYSRPAPIGDTVAPVLTPSNLGGAKALPGEAGQDEEAALRHGRLIHLLLEHLPRHAQGDWPRVAQGLLRGGPDAADPAEVPPLLAEAQAVLTAPGLADLFAPEALCEVSLTAELPGGRRLLGVADRLLLRPDRVTVADFKTNATVPAAAQDVPEGLLRQMGAYAHALAQIYPGRRVDCVLVWTRGAQRMDLPAGLTSAALARALAPKAPDPTGES